MIRLTSEEVFGLQKVTKDADGRKHIIPIVTNTNLSKQSSLGIEVVAEEISNERVEGQEGDAPAKETFTRKPIVVRDSEDPAAWYQVCNNVNVSYITKFKFNTCVWRYSAFFPGFALFVVMCQNWIIVVLDNAEVHFIDSENGCPCHPSILTAGKCIYVKSIGDKFVCFTEEHFLYVWRLYDESKIECLVRERWIGDIAPIEDIILVNELQDGSISPVLVTNSFSVRYSMSQNGWLFTGYEVPSGFTKSQKYETTYDCERAFFDAMMYHRGEEFLEAFTILMKCWMLEESKSKVKELMTEVFSFASDGCTRIGGVSMRLILEKGMSILSEVPDLAAQVQEQYDALMAVLPNEIPFSPERTFSPLKMIATAPKTPLAPLEAAAVPKKQPAPTGVIKEVITVTQKMQALLEADGSDIQISPDDMTIIQQQMIRKNDMLEAAKASLKDICMIEIIVKECLNAAEQEQLAALPKPEKKRPKRITEMCVSVPTFDLDDIKDFIEVSRAPTPKVEKVKKEKTPNTQPAPAQLPIGGTAPVLMQTPVQAPVLMQAPVQTPLLMQAPGQTPVLMQAPGQAPVLIQAPVQAPGLIQAPVQAPGLIQAPVQAHGLIQAPVLVAAPLQTYTYSIQTSYQVVTAPVQAPVTVAAPMQAPVPVVAPVQAPTPVPLQAPAAVAAPIQAPVQAPAPEKPASGINVKSLLRKNPDLVTKFKLSVPQFKLDDIEAIQQGTYKQKATKKQNQPKKPALNLVPEQPQ